MIEQVVVVVPAHNEEVDLPACLDHLGRVSKVVVAEHVMIV